MSAGLSRWLVRGLPLEQGLAVCAARTHAQVVRLKQCSSCAREIPESATVCDACSQWAADVVAVPSPPDAPERVAAPPAKADTVSLARGAVASRRELLLILTAVVGGGIITLALLSARGSAGARGATPTPAPSSLAAPQTDSSPSQKWSTENRAYWVGNRPKSAAFELAAENRVPVWQRHVRPALVVRCMSQSTQVFVVTESAMKIEPQTEDHTVTFGFDDEPNVVERWPDSDTHDALFAPDGAAFAHRLMRAKAFRFGYAPHNVAPVVAHFRVTGLGPLIEPVAKECGWKK